MAILWGSPEALILRGTVGEVDTVDYTDSDNAVHVDMSGAPSRTGQRPIFGGHAEGDRFVSIENVWGSAFNDNLVGDGVANGLFGFGGSDKITGGAGNDTLRGEGGGDTVIGGVGNDVLFGDDGADVVQGDAGDDSVHGGMGDDTLWGGVGRDVLYGGKEADVLVGGAGGQARGAVGEEWLEGGAGADVIYGDGVETNADGRITGPAGDETWSVTELTPQPSGPPTPQTFTHAFRDIASYSLSDGAVAINLSTATTVTVTPASGSTPAVTTSRVALPAAAGGHAAGDVLYGISGIRGSAFGDTLIGGAANDELYGNAGNDSILGGAGGDLLRGGKGDDTLLGGAGDDVLLGEAGADSLGGGLGNDAVSYINSPAAVTIDLTKRTAQSGGHAEGDTINADINDVTGSPHGDLLIGTAARDVLSGHGGNDWDNPATALSAAGARMAAARGGIFGGAGNDLMSGGAGNDLLAGEAGDDEMIAGPGDDYLHGGAGNDQLRGQGGNDTLNGGAGSNTLEGGDGDDIFIYRSGDVSRYVPGAGADVIDASAQTSAVTLTLAAGFSHYVGGTAADTITGNAANNRLEGKAGADSLAGGDGNDTLIGGGGADTLSGGTGANGGVDLFVIAKQAGVTTRITDFQKGEKIDISATGVTTAQLQTALRNQGNTGTKTVDLGSANGMVTVVLAGNLTALTTDDFML